MDTSVDVLSKAGWRKIDLYFVVPPRFKIIYEEDFVSYEIRVVKDF